MKVDNEGIVLDEDVANEPWRPFDQEDLDALTDAIWEIQEACGATSLPALESLYRQIQIRIKFED